MLKDPKNIWERKVCVTGDSVIMEPTKGLGNEGKQMTKI